MGTKREPAKFDCYANALPDEPMFVLLARDPLAPFLVSIWSAMRMADWEKATVVFETMMKRTGGRWMVDPDVAAASEAMDCSAAMFAWRLDNDGAWRRSTKENADA